MKTRTKLFLSIGTVLILAGLILFTVVLSICDFDIRKLTTIEYITTEHSVNESFTHINIKAQTADVEFLPSENDEITVICYEEEKVRHTVSIDDGTLVIKAVNNKKWYEHIGINFDTAKITVYMPAGQYGNLTVDSRTSNVNVSSKFAFESVDISLSTGDVMYCAYSSDSIKIKTSTGHISLEYLSANRIDLKASTGKISASEILCNGEFNIKVSTGDTKLSNVVCGTLKSSGSTGDLTMKYVVASDKFSLKRSTGDIKMTSCDASEIYATTDTGHVTGSLRTSKVFITKTDTGKIMVPDSIIGGRCEITTDTGDIIIAID